MHRRFVLLVCLSAALVGVGLPAASAVPGTNRTLSVTGTAAAMFPAFQPGITRYAVTTEASTNGVLTVAATTSDPDGRVWVNGEPATGPTQVTNLSSGDEVSVIIDDADGTTPYSVMYLPAQFPRLNVTTHQGGLEEGYIAMTLGTYEQNPLPSFDAIVDRNGVPVWAIPAIGADLDLRQQPNGEITISRLSNVPGKTGHSLVTLDDQLREQGRQDVVAPLTNTDAHDSIKLADGTTVLTGYEFDQTRTKTDATIQKLDAQGNEIFRWSSASIESETTAGPQNQGDSGDYAHINSVVSVENDDIIASFRHTSSVLRIATVAHHGYQPGDIIWKLGGRDSTFTFVDDPYDGPCAQHTASELANGNIVIYDNGSSGLCVDQNDPTGPTVNRGVTRVTEYALDLNNNTATLVWSYAPANTYAWFAGSARRTANGNTLIGWADARRALATEVSAAKEVLWEVDTLPAPAGHRNYITYRAELITNYSDKIKPSLQVTGPAENATFLQGEAIAASATCTDRGGSNLATCSTTAASNGQLATDVVGNHTWTATATDGAGNTATVTRHYRVQSPTQVSDGLIRRGAVRSWTGNNVYGSAVRQKVIQRGRSGAVRTSYWRVQNDGQATDTFRLAGTARNRAFVVRYWSNGKNVTRAVTAGTFRTKALAPGQSQQLRVVTKPLRVRKAPSVKTFILRSASVSGDGTDRVAIRVRRTR